MNEKLKPDLNALALDAGAALQALFLEVDESIAVDVKNKILAYTDALKAGIIELENQTMQGQWVSVEDDMPLDGITVLCYAKKYNDVFSAMCHNKNNEARFQHGTAFYWAGTEVTHWRPLPPTPFTI